MFLIVSIFLIGCAINIFCELKQPEVYQAFYWWIPMVVGAVMGAVKGKKNEEANKRDRRIRSETIRYSPWTNMSDPGETERPGMGDSILGGAAGGLGIGSMIDQGKPTPKTGEEWGQLSREAQATTPLPTQQVESNTYPPMQESMKTEVGSAGSLGSSPAARKISQLTPAEQAYLSTGIPKWKHLQ